MTLETGYYVDPANTASISRQDLNNRNLFTMGDDSTAYSLPPDRFPIFNPKAPDDVYQATLATYPFLRNYYGAPTLAFSGTVKDQAARVVETATPVSLLDLYNIKSLELNSYALDVFNSPFEFEIGGIKYWVRNSEIDRSARSSYNGFLGPRGHDILYDAVQAGITDAGGTNSEVAAWWTSIKGRQTGLVADQYWTRDIKVFLVRQSDNKQVTDNANQNQWSLLMEAEATFNWQIRNAVDRVRQDMSAAYGDGTGVPGGAEWSQLAAIDPTDDVLYNWPTHYVSPPADPLGAGGPA